MSQSIEKNADPLKGKITQLRTYFTWIIDQPGDTPLKYIKELTHEQFSNLKDIEEKFSLHNQLLISEKNNLIDELRIENEILTEKMTEGVQDIINELQQKLNESNYEISGLNELNKAIKVRKI